MKADTKKWLKRGAILLFLAAACVITVRLLPWFTELIREQEAREAFKTYITSLGWKGFFYMLGIQVLQVIISVLPGEPVELVAGMIYGAWGGLALCLLGLCIGSSLVFFTVRALGKDFVTHRMSHEHKGLLTFLNDSKKIELLTFVLFFIPGTPKDMLTYIAPLTKIKPASFLLIATLARIPSVITSTYAGTTFINGELWKTAAMFVFMGILGIGGIMASNKLMDKRKNLKSESGKNNMNEHEASIIGEIKKQGTLKISRFELRNTHEDDIISTALDNVWICAANDSMELVKARAAAISKLSDDGIIAVEYADEPTDAKKAGVYGESDIFALLCSTVDEGRGKEGFLFDCAAITCGKLSLTEKGGIA